MSVVLLKPDKIASIHGQSVEDPQGFISSVLDFVAQGHTAFLTGVISLRSQLSLNEPSLLSGCGEPWYRSSQPYSLKLKSSDSGGGLITIVLWLLGLEY